MGHKKPARANRLGVWVKREKDPKPRMVAEHESNWFASFDDFRTYLERDWKIRRLIDEKYGKKAGVSRVQVNRKSNRTIIDVYCVKPATILGKDNKKVEELTAVMKEEIDPNVKVNVIEARFTDPKLIAERIALDLERRIAFRKACKGAISKAMSTPDVIGIKIIVSGRLGGAEIARSEWYLEGKVPLHTLHANIDNGFAEAETTYGIIGVKVIIHRNAQLKNISGRNARPDGSRDQRDQRDQKNQENAQKAAA